MTRMINEGTRKPAKGNSWRDRIARPEWVDLSGPTEDAVTGREAAVTGREDAGEQPSAKASNSSARPSPMQRVRRGIAALRASYQGARSASAAFVQWNFELWSGRKVGDVDIVIAALVTLLIGFGVVMVYSASVVDATVRLGNPEYYLQRQAIYGVMGLGLMWAMSAIDYRRVRPLTYPALFLVLGLLVATIAGVGHRAGNAYRWISLGPVHVQPAEMAKVALVLWLAYSLSKKQEHMLRSFKLGFLPHMIMVGALALLCLKQPDFGSAVVLMILTFALMLVAGVKVGYLSSAGALAAMAGVALIRFSPYRYKRFLAWQDMSSNVQDLAYQPFQSVLSFGSGGLTGTGLGQGLQVLHLPEAYTDFVSAIIGEEFGFVGIVVLCCVYALFFARGVRAALRAPDDYGTYLAFGISTLFAVQVLINLAVAMALAPTKGLTLPFLSYGGSSLLVNAAAAGILLSISRHARTEASAGSVESSAESTGPGGDLIAATSA